MYCVCVVALGPYIQGPCGPYMRALHEGPVALVGTCRGPKHYPMCWALGPCIEPWGPGAGHGVDKVQYMLFGPTCHAQGLVCGHTTKSQNYKSAFCAAIHFAVSSPATCLALLFAFAGSMPLQWWGRNWCGEGPHGRQYLCLN